MPTPYSSVFDRTVPVVLNSLASAGRHCHGTATAGVSSRHSTLTVHAHSEFGGPIRMAYDSFWGDTHFSDVSVVLREEPGPSGSKRKRDETLPAHRLALAAHSAVLKAQLLNWTPESSTSADKPEVVVEAPEDQIGVAKLLIKTMYQASPDFSGLQQELLLQLLLLADKYGVPRTAKAVTTAISTAGIEWNIVHQLYRLPEVVQNSKQLAEILAAAAKHIQQNLGDSDVVWADEQGLQQQLLKLPYAAFKQLLAESTTRVASENTAAYSVMRWVEQWKPEDEQLCELISLVRMAHCATAYVATVMSSADSCFSRCLAAEELQVAVAVSALGCDAEEADNPTIRRFPNWCADKRPASALDKLTIEWQVLLDDLRPLVEQSLCRSERSEPLQGKQCMHQGVTLVATLRMYPPDNGTLAGLGIFMHPTEANNLLCKVQGRFAIDCAPWSGQRPVRPSLPSALVRGNGQGRGYRRIIKFGTFNSWAGVDGHLRGAHLVHAELMAACT